MHTFYHIPGVAASQTRAQLLHLSMLGQHLWACSGNERAKGQAARVHPWSRGQGAVGQGAGREGQRIRRPEMHTKMASIANSIGRILCQPHYSS